jgi:hypothetical protein
LGLAGADFDQDEDAVRWLAEAREYFDKESNASWMGWVGESLMPNTAAKVREEARVSREREEAEAEERERIARREEEEAAERQREEDAAIKALREQEVEEAKKRRMAEVQEELARLDVELEEGRISEEGFLRAVAALEPQDEAAVDAEDAVDDAMVVDNLVGIVGARTEDGEDAAADGLVEETVPVVRTGKRKAEAELPRPTTNSGKVSLFFSSSMRSC